VIFNVFSHLNKSFLGSNLEKYNFQSFSIDKVIQILNFATKVVIFYLYLSKSHFCNFNICFDLYRSTVIAQNVDFKFH